MTAQVVDELDRGLPGILEIVQKEQRLKEIAADQERLRANLEKVPPTSEAYKRYLKKFDTQESEIEQLQEAVKQLKLRNEPVALFLGKPLIDNDIDDQKLQGVIVECALELGKHQAPEAQSQARDVCFRYFQ